MRLSLCSRIAIFISVFSGLAQTHAATAPGHERLRVKNNFAKPEEVVTYYCARDASGFVWSGMLDLERKAFTLWTDAPQQDTFLIAKAYEVMPAKLNGKDSATVEVRYQLTGAGDANGAKLPVAESVKVVQFNLKRIGGVWKIEKPESGQIAAVVLESKFPVHLAQK